MNFPPQFPAKAKPSLQQHVELGFTSNVLGISQSRHSIHWHIFTQSGHLQAAERSVSKTQLPDVSGVKFGVLIALRLTDCLLIWVTNASEVNAVHTFHSCDRWGKHICFCPEIDTALVQLDQSSPTAWTGGRSSSCEGRIPALTGASLQFQMPPETPDWPMVYGSNSSQAVPSSSAFLPPHAACWEVRKANYLEIRNYLA